MDEQSKKFEQILKLLFLIELQSYVIGILYKSYKSLEDGQRNKKIKM